MYLEVLGDGVDLYLYGVVRVFEIVGVYEVQYQWDRLYFELQVGCGLYFVFI